jgi:hypothetical protein
MLSLQLMISRSSEKIRRLNKLGFHHGEISLPYILILFLLLFIVTILSLLASNILANKLTDMAMELNLEIGQGLSGTVYLVAIGLILLLFILNTFSIFISTRRLCKG